LIAIIDQSGHSREPPQVVQLLLAGFSVTEFDQADFAHHQKSMENKHQANSRERDPKINPRVFHF
jgi:hypothetical protein